MPVPTSVGSNSSTFARTSSSSALLPRKNTLAIPSE